MISLADKDARYGADTKAGGAAHIHKPAAGEVRVQKFMENVTAKQGRFQYFAAVLR